MKQNIVKKVEYGLDFNLIKNIFLRICVFLWSFYTGSLLLPLFELKYSNPYEIIGPLTNLQYNSNNNSIRYIFLLFFVPSLFFLIHWLIEKKKLFLVRIIFIITVLLFFFISNTSIYLTKFHNIDMFHDGEQLGVGSSLYLFNKEPYKNTFFLHGAFADPLIAFFSFKLFGHSIGSFYLILSLLNLFTIFSLMLLLVVIIKNETLFYTSVMFFWGSLFTKVFYRDLTSFIFIILVYFLVKKKIRSNFGLYLTSFLSFATFYISIDRGYYLFASNFLLISLIIISSFTNKSKIIPFFKRLKLTLKENIKTIVAYIFGNLTAITLGLISFGLTGFNNFLLITFIQINKMKPFLDEYIYPKFSSTSIFPFWFPIIIVLCMIIYLIYFTKLNKKIYIFPSILVFMSAIYFRNAIGRSDLGHVLYVSHFIFLSLFILIDSFIKNKSTLPWQYMFIFLLFITKFFNKNIIINIPDYNRSDIKIFFKLNTLDDKFWLNQEQIDVTFFIEKNTSENDHVFVFTNESAYYYLFSRKSPTRFYTIWFASPNFFQKEVVESLEQNKPKYIIYHSNHWSNNIDSISNKERLQTINNWIVKNYKFNTKINNTEIYSLIN